MNIKFTNRNVYKCANIKKNFNYSMCVADLEPLIDGAVIDNNLFDLRNNTELFKKFVMEKIHLSGEEYNRIFEPLKRLSAFDFLENPYLKNISLPIIASGNIKIEEVYYKKNEFAFLDEPKQSPNLLRKYSVGIFDNEAFTYVLKGPGFVWMSINPMEINTAKTAVDNAYGNVLVLGGGLGYYPYMVSLKENVKSVTIIESNSHIKDILEAVIIPQFPNKKVTIIYDDAYDFLKNTPSSKYDSVYIDIWKDNVEGSTEYRKFVKFESLHPNSHFDYWLENSILDDTVINIYQYFSAKLGTEEYQKFFSVIAPDLWNYLESVHDTISIPEQMDYYLTKVYAKQILKNI